MSEPMDVTKQVSWRVCRYGPRGVCGIASKEVDAHGDDGGSELDRWRHLGPCCGVCVAGLSSVCLRGIAGWMEVGPHVNLSLIWSRDSHVIVNMILSLLYSVVGHNLSSFHYTAN